jgi:putative IMPACT (imprinted ancient) family translation regulator
MSLQFSYFLSISQYIGGIKLGAGGLIRAYGSCARLVLRQAPKIQCIPKSTFILKIPSSYSGPVYSLATKFSAVIGDTQYEDDGSVQIHITCDTDDVMHMMEDIRDATRGDVVFLN